MEDEVEEVGVRKQLNGARGTISPLTDNDFDGHGKSQICTCLVFMPILPLYNPIAYSNTSCLHVNTHTHLHHPNPIY